jgi:hypothetical protein
MLCSSNPSWSRHPYNIMWRVKPVSYFVDKYDIEFSDPRPVLQAEVGGTWVFELTRGTQISGSAVGVCMQASGTYLAWDREQYDEQ